ncbi:MAG: zinc ribbon domain-containing protein [Oscillibacter sp.]|nr:zinc ribbon domain-containing protein [Oscillibacter sp.]
MGVLNDFLEKAKGVMSAATDKAKSVASVTKINVAIAGEQKEIDKNCLAIGQWFVSDYDGEIPDGVKDLVDAVNASKAKIAELEASKPVKAEEPAEAGESAKGGKPCPICGEVSDSKFCPHCGAPMGD